MIQDQIGMIVATFIVLGQMSMLFGDNPFFKLTTKITIGFGLGYFALSNLNYLNRVAFTPIAAEGDLKLLIPLILGLMLYTRFIRGAEWISKYPIHTMLGVGIGVITVSMLRAQVIDQIAFTVSDIFNADTSMELLNSIIVLVGVVSVISYFFLTREQTGILGKVSYIGRIFIMSSLAIIFAGDYLWTMTALAGVLKFLIKDIIMGLLLGIT